MERLPKPGSIASSSLNAYVNGQGAMVLSRETSHEELVGERSEDLSGSGHGGVSGEFFVSGRYFHELTWNEDLPTKAELEAERKRASLTRGVCDRILGKTVRYKETFSGKCLTVTYGKTGENSGMMIHYVVIDMIAKGEVPEFSLSGDIVLRNGKPMKDSKDAYEAIGSAVSAALRGMGYEFVHERDGVGHNQIIDIK
jgi:hypothetical protein